MSTVIVIDGDETPMSISGSTDSAADNLIDNLNESNKENSGIKKNLLYFVNLVKGIHLGKEETRMTLPQLLFGAGRPNSTVWGNGEVSQTPDLKERYGNVLDDLETVYHFDEAAFKKAFKVMKYGAIGLSIVGLAAVCIIYGTSKK